MFVSYGVCYCCEMYVKSVLCLCYIIVFQLYVECEVFDTIIRVSNCLSVCSVLFHWHMIVLSVCIIVLLGSVIMGRMEFYEVTFVEGMSCEQKENYLG